MRSKRYHPPMPQDRYAKYKDRAVRLGVVGFVVLFAGFWLSDHGAPFGELLTWLCLLGGAGAILWAFAWWVAIPSED